jgi:hypothetical protein
MLSIGKGGGATTTGLMTQVDHRGRSFLHYLVTNGNIRSLDLAFTPNGHIAWDLALAVPYSLNDDAVPSFFTFTRDEKGTSVRDAAKLLGRHDMVKMIDEYAMWQTPYELACTLQAYPDFGKVKAKILPKFGGIPDASIIRKLRRIISLEIKWTCLMQLEIICRSVVAHGNLPLLSWLVEAEPVLLHCSSTGETTTANCNEFAQPELFDQAEERGPCESLGNVSLAAHGQSRNTRETTVEGRKFYASDVLASFLRCSSEKGLAAYIKKMMVERTRYLAGKYEAKILLERKLHLLTDDDSLSQRLQMLEYLVNVQGQACPQRA